MIVDGEEYAAPIVYKAFPGRVVQPDGHVIDRVLAIITPDVLYAFGQTETEPRRPYLALRVVLASGPNASPVGTGGAWVAVDETGGEWGVTHASGCGACQLPALNGLSHPLQVRWPAYDPSN